MVTCRGFCLLTNVLIVSVRLVSSMMSVCLSVCLSVCCFADVDECLLFSGICQWQCVNQPGSFRCVCPEGYQLQGPRLCQGTVSSPQ